MSRVVPLLWDAGTLRDLAEWKELRLQGGAGLQEPLVASRRAGRERKVYSRHSLRKRFLTTCKSLEPDRVAALTIRQGRHTFNSHALTGGRTLAEVRDTAGHANVSITSAYLNVAVDDETVEMLFEWGVGETGSIG